MGRDGMIEANKGFRRLKAHKQLSVLRAALQAHHNRMTIKSVAHVTRAA
jgi:putative transposase